jgi:hypothetical protein
MGFSDLKFNRKRAFKLTKGKKSFRVSMENKYFKFEYSRRLRGLFTRNIRMRYRGELVSFGAKCTVDLAQAGPGRWWSVIERDGRRTRVLGQRAVVALERPVGVHIGTEVVPVAVVEARTVHTGNRGKWRYFSSRIKFSLSLHNDKKIRLSTPFSSLSVASSNSY